MKTCAYLFLTLALIGVVWAQRDLNFDDDALGDSNFGSRSEASFYGSPSKGRSSFTDLRSRSPTESDVESASLDSKIALIEKQITILTNCYNKMRSALQSMSRKMPSQNAMALVLDENKEILIVLNTLSDKMKLVERALEKLSFLAMENSGSRGNNKEVSIALDTMSNRMTTLEGAMAKLSNRAMGSVASGGDNKETMVVLDGMSDRMMKVEGALTRMSAQMNDVSQQLAESKTAGGSVVSSAGNDSEAALLSREILVVVKAMSQKIDKMGTAPLATTADTVSLQGMESKISELESAIQQLSLQVTSLASQKPQETSASSLQMSDVDKISNLENAIQQLSLQITSLASQKETGLSVQNVASDASVLNQEAMVLFRAMSEKLDRIETLLASGAPAVSEDVLVSIVGAVGTPGKVKVDGTGKKDLLEAISEVGGFAPMADKTAVTVRRGPKVFTIDVERIMNENLLSFMLEGKDIVVVKEKEKEEKKSFGLPSQAFPPAKPSDRAPAPKPAPSAVAPRIESEPTAESLPKFKTKPKLAPQTGGIFPRGEDGKEGVLQREVTALRFE